MSSPEKQTRPRQGRTITGSLLGPFLGLGLAGAGLGIVGTDNPVLPLAALGFAVVGTLVAIREPRNPPSHTLRALTEEASTNRPAAKTVPTPRWVRPVAWGLFGTYFVLIGATVGLVLTRSSGQADAFVVLSSGYAVVGALVATREPRNAVGWLLLGIAISFAFGSFIDTYAAETGRPAQAALDWIGGWSWHLPLTLTALILPLVFPNGRLLSRRWRPALWIALASMSLNMVSDGLRSGPFDVDSTSTLLRDGGRAASVIDALDLMGDLLVAVGFVLSATSLVLRLRRSRGRERQQVKWFVYVAGLALCAFGPIAVGSSAVASKIGNPAWAEAVSSIGWSVTPLLFVGIPIAIGAAMLRHRLYDIDLVIKRTLVYGALTVLLAALYLTMVLGLRTLLNPLTGQSDLAVAASTLAVAALFRPLRTQIQSLVDRRFYRQRYDATQAAEAFTSRLRHEVDLDAVTTDLLEVVQETLQPDQATVWLRKTT